MDPLGISASNCLMEKQTLGIPGQMCESEESECDATEMKERVRKRKSITEKSMVKGGRVRNIDIRNIKWDISENKLKEWTTEGRKKRVTKMVAILLAVQLVLVSVQCSGVLAKDNGRFLTNSDNSKTPYYHAIVAAISTTAIAQLILIHKYYMMELEMLPTTNPLWVKTTLWDSPILRYYVTEILIFSLHEPPGLAFAWTHSYKLSMLCLFKSHIFWRLLADMSYTQQQGGKLVSAIARIRITWTYQLRAAAYTHPWVFQVAISITCLIVLSACTVISNDALLSAGDALWLTFAVMTSGDPRITEPDNWLAKVISGFATIVGLVLVSLLITQISRSIELTAKQKRVLLFMSQAQRHQEIEELAARILCRGFVNSRLKSENQPQSVIQKGRSELSALCEEFRCVRRGFNSSVADFHALWPDNLPVAAKLREINTMTSVLFEEKFSVKKRKELLKDLSTTIAQEESPFQSRRETTRFIQRTKQREVQCPQGTASSCDSPLPDVRACSDSGVPNAVTNGKVVAMLETILKNQHDMQMQCAELAKEVKELKAAKGKRKGHGNNSGGQGGPPSPPASPAPEPP
eukprot:TRINITY_DN4304_c1_g1_i1.p1 TRINITY_DN4304_c1_g1~~TRINITY_DN4304_c1_g1_i1.p1  ORF type:complete len:594 (+),score=64.40 TRINITY_DN4304_c1_g1_i1:50-1783(+)